ncbi:MAG: hypothetical protein RR036_04640 [Oscillospiraceae bacterium]
MLIKKYNHLSENEIESFTDLLSESFRKNDFIFNYLMGKNENRLRRFMKMTVEYNNNFADFYTLVDEDEKLYAAVIYLPANCEPLAVGTAFKRKKLLTLLKSFLIQPVKYTKRLIDFSELEAKHWYKDPFITLDIVASREKGCGKRLIEETLKNYAGQNIALNSSVGNINHSYYTQFGFEVYEKIVMDKYTTAMMVKK